MAVERLPMADRIEKNELARRLAARMKTDEETAAAWIDGFIDALYESIKAGESVTLTGLGGFYVKPKRDSWVFRFNPGQKLRALFGWSSKYKGKL
jgi:DNA-binding protein HU-beta